MPGKSIDDTIKTQKLEYNPYHSALNNSGKVLYNIANKGKEEALSLYKKASSFINKPRTEDESRLLREETIAALLGYIGGSEAGRYVSQNYLTESVHKFLTSGGSQDVQDLASSVLGGLIISALAISAVKRNNKI